MSHTPEPWYLIKDGCEIMAKLAEMSHAHVAEVFHNDADARRIVAAVNACAGIETYALELMTGELSLLNQITHKPQENPTKKAAQYRKQRDDLLAALERLIEGTMSMPNRGRATEGKWTTINALTSSVDSAKAAIAAAKAGA